MPRTPSRRRCHPPRAHRAASPAPASPPTPPTASPSPPASSPTPSTPISTPTKNPSTPPRPSPTKTSPANPSPPSPSISTSTPSVPNPPSPAKPTSAAASATTNPKTSTHHEKRGSITISHIDADSYGDLTSALHFIAPDDGNAEDHTVAEIPLPHPLAPNDSITFHLAFHDQFPLSVARNGYKRDFIMGGQWYPKPGVFWHGAWNCHQYHATTEFFSDFATFNVSPHPPPPLRRRSHRRPHRRIHQRHPDSTKTLSFYGEDIGDFALAASPNFTVTDGIFLSSLGPVQIHVLALAAHPKAGPRYLDIIQKTMAQFDQTLRPLSLQNRHRHRPRTRLRDGRHGVPHPLHRRHLLVRAHLHHRAHRRARVRPPVLVRHGRHQRVRRRLARRRHQLLHRSQSPRRHPRPRQLRPRPPLRQRRRLRASALRIPRQARLRPRHPLGLQVPQRHLLRRHHLRQIRHAPRNPRRHHRPRHHGRSHAHLLPALPLHPPHHRRLPPHHRRSRHRPRQSHRHSPRQSQPNHRITRTPSISTEPTDSLIVHSAVGEDRRVSYVPADQLSSQRTPATEPERPPLCPTPTLSDHPTPHRIRLPRLRHRPRHQLHPPPLLQSGRLRNPDPRLRRRQRSPPPPSSGGSPNPKTKRRSNTSPPSTSTAKATSSSPSPSKSSSTTAPASASTGTASTAGPNSSTPATQKSSPPRSTPTTPSSSTPTSSTTATPQNRTPSQPANSPTSG